jgi:hypothetical protein
MVKYVGIPELLEKYMQESGELQRWITVREIRNRYALSPNRASTISGFLRRIEHRPFFTFPYVVVRVEHSRRPPPDGRRQIRYLVKRREVYQICK